VKIVFSIEDCRTLIWVVENALVDARVISKKECERVLGEDDEGNSKKLDKADSYVAKRLEKAFGNLESSDVDLADACS